MIIKDLKSLFASMRYFLKLIFISKEYDVVFVGSAYFNRGEKGENLLFKPMIENCKKNDLSYIVLEDTDLKGEYVKFPRFKESTPFDFISLVQVILRKIYNLIYKKPITEEELYIREFKTSKIIKRLFFTKFRSKIYITLLWNNVTLWRRINHDACVVDYQHGIICDGHPRYIKNGEPPKVKSSNDVFTLVYGDVFKSILINSDKSNFYNEENVMKIGFNKTLNKQKKLISGKKKIIFTLQIVPDFNEEDNNLYIKMVQKLISTNANFLSKNNYEIIFKHHPRHNTTNCRDIHMNHDFISFDNETPLSDLLSKAYIHMTFHSTSAFDAAMMNIPTVFIDMHEKFSPNESFIKQFEYPYKDLVVKDYKDFEHILSKLNTSHIYEKFCDDTYKWVQELYSDFDETAFENFLLDQISIHKNDVGGRTYQQ